jgi:hypothetical protein
MLGLLKINNISDFSPKNLTFEVNTLLNLRQYTNCR